MKSKITKNDEAVARNKAWASMTPTQQLEYLDTNKLAATKQRKKLAEKMAK